MYRTCPPTSSSISFSLCDNDGNCIYDYDDIAFAQNFKGAADIQLVTTSTGAGQIYANGELIGTYQYNGFFYDGIEEALGNQADATMDLIGHLTTQAVIGGVVGFGSGKVIEVAGSKIAPYVKTFLADETGAIILTKSEGSVEQENETSQRQMIIDLSMKY